MEEGQVQERKVVEIKKRVLGFLNHPIFKGIEEIRGRAWKMTCLKRKFMLTLWE